MLGCRGTAQFRRVVLPASLPAIFTGLRLGLGFAWVVIVVGEMTGVQTGSAPSSWRRASSPAPRSSSPA
jgi:NitT/TauT family transport system permease protein